MVVTTYYVKPANSRAEIEYAACAAVIRTVLEAYRANGRTGDVGALRETLAELAAVAPSPAHRAVARDLQDALSSGRLKRALRMAVTASRRPDLGAEKIVSRKYRYVWLCVPKVASRSIRNILCSIDPDADLIKGKSISKVHAEHPEARDYFSFAFVREPGRRVFSFYGDKYLQPTDFKRRIYVDRYHGTSPAFSFDDLCRWLNTPYGSDAFADRHWLSQSRQVTLDDGRLPDFVGRHENLNADFRAVCEWLGMPVRPLPTLNTLAGWDPTAEELRRAAAVPDTHLNERNRTLLRERYAEDYALLNHLESGRERPAAGAGSNPGGGGVRIAKKLDEGAPQPESESAAADGADVPQAAPRPQCVWYNDWRQAQVPMPEAFTPVLPVSVIVPYYAQPEELERTLAALEGQTYPRDLFEVVVVDDGSPEPLVRPPSTPLDLKVVRQEDQGFGLARARNTGVRATAHDVLVFLDADTLPEAGWLAAHARWHHAVWDAVTLGPRVHVDVDGVDAGAIRNRTGTLDDLFAGRQVDPSWVEKYMAGTNDLTLRSDDPFRVLVGANFGVGRGFYELMGGMDESFTQWGNEDQEFGFRAYTRGGLLVPVRDAKAWHQGRWGDGRETKDQSRLQQQGKVAHLFAHPRYRSGQTGRTFKVPQFVVTVEAHDLPADLVLTAVEHVLSGPMHDLVVRVELSPDHEGREWLERQLGPDPRVRVAPAASALDEFPASSFHVALPAGTPLHPDVVRRLHAGLGKAVLGRSVLPDGSRVSIARAWALHRAQRTSLEAFDFGEVVRIAAEKLIASEAQAPLRAAETAGNRRTARTQTPLRRLRAELRQVDGPRAAWRFLRWLGGAVWWRVAGRLRGAQPPPAPASPGGDPPAAGRAVPAARAEYALGVEIVALGPRARAVFEASRRVVRTTGPGQHVDVAVADTAAEAAGVAAPVVVLAESPPPLSVPAFDARTDNPTGWSRKDWRTVAALGPLDQLPPGCAATRVVDRGNRRALRWIHHLEDVQGFHSDPVARAGELARLAAGGVVVHLADGDDRRLEPYLGAELFELMTGEVRDLDLRGREALSARMRRAALREHSLGSRARQVAERALADPPRLPLVSVLLITRRPELLERALCAVRRQSYPRLELILGLHGEGFGDVGSDAAGPATRVTVLRLDAALPLGSALNAATEEARGPLLTKMDDDDVYGPDHVWDLVLAQEYSQASLVGKTADFVYLAGADRTIRRISGRNEWHKRHIAGGAMLITRQEVDRVGGWPRVVRHVDTAMINAVVQAGSPVYTTHPYGFLLVRHGRQHTWEIGDSYFLATADIVESGWRPDLADVAGAPRVYA